jgi:hypothetical protein
MTAPLMQPDRDYPHGLWSLWDIMINYSLFGLCKVLEGLQSIQTEFETRVDWISAELKGGTPYDEIMKSGIPHAVTETDKSELYSYLKLAAGEAERLSLREVYNRVGRFKMRLDNGNISINEVAVEIRVLRETFETDLQKVYFHHYDPNRVVLLNTIKGQWLRIFFKFNSMEQPITCAIDCYALGLYNGCVFYLMNVMEAAVHKFGKKLGVNLIQKSPGKRIRELNWENILNELTPRLKTLPQNTVKQKRLFEKYSTMQAFLYSIKDAWRNPTLHPRDDGYNASETLNIINQVKSFLSELSESL